MAKREKADERLGPEPALPRAIGLERKSAGNVEGDE